MSHSGAGRQELVYPPVLKAEAAHGTPNFRYFRVRLPNSKSKNSALFVEFENSLLSALSLRPNRRKNHSANLSDKYKADGVPSGNELPFHYTGKNGPDQNNVVQKFSSEVQYLLNCIFQQIKY